MSDTVELLAAWVERGSEEAFRQLVTRHIDLVHSVAIRKVGGDTGLAADITQTVFADLARKARTLRAEGSLAGWLHRHTCHIAATALRSELRRRAREQTAAAMHALENSPDPDWFRVAPLLDDAVNALDDLDRRAILLRFYEHRDLRAVGDLLGISDDAAQKRVTRALEKLRVWLARRGVVSTGAVLGTLLGAHGVAAAPAGLAAVVASQTLAAGAGAGAVTLLELMTHAKAKIAVGAAVAAIVVAPAVWQENAIADIRSENRALAARAESLQQLETGQNPLAAQANAEDEAARVARDRAELDRLRNDAAALRQQVERARATRIAAAPARPGRRSPTSPGDEVGLPAGFISMAKAEDVGNATGEALLQTFFHAMASINTNRLLQLGDWTGEGGFEGMKEMMEAMSDPDGLQKFKDRMGDFGFRFLREVPLENGDFAVVMEMARSGATRRQAMRVRQWRGEWRLVMDKGGPEEVKLSDEQTRD